jgi:hypothetical protein
MKRIVLCVEGQGEVEALPILVKKLLAAKGLTSTTCVDPIPPFRVGGFFSLLPNGFESWRNKVQAAMKRRDAGGVLLMLDSDVLTDKQSTHSCPVEAARQLIRAASHVGAGSRFPLAVVFACQEFESWFISAFDGLAGKRLPDGRQIRAAATDMPPNPEIAPKAAKAWLNRQIEGGYKPTRDQSALTQLLDIENFRSGRCRSFARLESAVGQLANAIRTGIHVATPG